MSVEQVNIPEIKIKPESLDEHMNLLLVKSEEVCKQHEGEYICEVKLKEMQNLKENSQKLWYIYANSLDKYVNQVV